jgi:hypothetical protein
MIAESYIDFLNIEELKEELKKLKLKIFGSKAAFRECLNKILLAEGTENIIMVKTMEQLRIKLMMLKKIMI